MRFLRWWLSEFRKGWREGWDWADWEQEMRRGHEG